MIIAAPYLLQTSFNLMRHSVKLSFDKSRKIMPAGLKNIYFIFFHFIMLHQRKQENNKRFGEEKYLGQTKLL